MGHIVTERCRGTQVVHLPLCEAAGTPTNLTEFGEPAVWPSGKNAGAGNQDAAVGTLTVCSPAYGRGGTGGSGEPGLEPGCEQVALGFISNQVLG